MCPRTLAEGRTPVAAEENSLAHMSLPGVGVPIAGLTAPEPGRFCPAGLPGAGVAGLPLLGIDPPGVGLDGPARPGEACGEGTDASDALTASTALGRGFLRGGSDGASAGAAVLAGTG